MGRVAGPGSGEAPPNYNGLPTELAARFIIADRPFRERPDTRPYGPVPYASVCGVSAGGKTMVDKYFWCEGEPLPYSAHKQPGSGKADHR